MSIIQYDIYGKPIEVKEPEIKVHLIDSIAGFNGSHKNQFKTVKEFLIAYIQSLNKRIALADYEDKTKCHLLKEELRKNLKEISVFISKLIE